MLNIELSNIQKAKIELRFVLNNAEFLENHHRKKGDLVFADDFRKVKEGVANALALLGGEQC